MLLHPRNGPHRTDAHRSAPPRRGRRRVGARAAVLVTVLLSTCLLVARPATAAPPDIPPKSTAQAELNALTVAPEGPLTGYTRDLFPHWSTVSGTCNTRETVLKRDGAGVVTNSSCAAVSGTWYSPYDGATWTAAADVDIDHVVALAEAWRSGASSWTTSRRQAFANDLARPQLVAVTDDVNQAKGDRDPASWQPPRSAYRCTYARMWIRAKYHWGLTLQAAEKSALQAMLDSCAP